MTRLGGYLFRLFAAEAAGLFAVALTILYLSQTLRIVEIDALRDRGFLTVLWQTVLAIPPLSIAFMYLCIAIGLARVLRGLQMSRELHVIHVGQQLGTLLRTILAFALAGTVVVLLLAHVLVPMTKQANSDLEARAAADLVGRSLVPNRFATLARGVTVSVGGRGPRGEITSFFADDRRDGGVRRTYIADSALITRDEEGYVLQLASGTIQYRTAEGQFSEISFVRYDISLERLTGEAGENERASNRTSWAILMRGLGEGDWPEASLSQLAERTADGLRVLALCLFVTALAAFPSGRRREPLVPMEVVVLGAVLVERAVTSYLPAEDWLRHIAGVSVLVAASALVLLWRLRAALPLPRWRAPA